MTSFWLSFRFGSIEWWYYHMAFDSSSRLLPYLSTIIVCLRGGKRKEIVNYEANGWNGIEINIFIFIFVSKFNDKKEKNGKKFCLNRKKKKNWIWFNIFFSFFSLLFLQFKQSVNHFYVLLKLKVCCFKKKWSNNIKTW